MRRSVICHTNDIDSTDENNNTCDSHHDDENYRKQQQQQQRQQQQQQLTNTYSVQSLLATKRNSENRKIPQLESKDSGFEDDDDLGKSPAEEDNRHIASPKSFFQNVSDSLSPRPAPDLILHKTSKTNTYSSGSYNTQHLSLENDSTQEIISQRNFADDDLKHIQLMDPNSIQFKRRFESSVLNALRDPQIQYLLTLYSFVDERLLRNTLLKFLGGSSLDTDTLHAAESYLNKIHPTKEDHTDNTKHFGDSFSKSDALFDFIAQNRQQTQSPTPCSTDSERQRTEYHLQQVKRDTFSRQGDTGEGCFTKYDSNKMGKVHEARCEYCQKTFSNEQSLTRHLRTHEGKRSHKCSQCSRSFYDQASYMRHIRSHSGDKKHKCEQCSMAFNKRSALEVHIRTHTGERPFVCKYCGKGFSISGNLHRHVLIHTGHRPYKCGKCPRAFNNPSHLARHINSFHT